MIYQSNALGKPRFHRVSDTPNSVLQDFTRAMISGLNKQAWDVSTQAFRIIALTRASWAQSLFTRIKWPKTLVSNTSWSPSAVTLSSWVSSPSAVENIWITFLKQEKTVVCLLKASLTEDTGKHSLLPCPAPKRHLPCSYKNTHFSDCVHVRI